MNSHVCPRCEQPTLHLVDDDQWCFTCDYRELLSAAVVPLAPSPARVAAAAGGTTSHRERMPSP